MKIWIDTSNGTWGEVDSDQGRLLIVDLHEQAALDSAAGEPVDAMSLIAALESMSDSAIAEYGDEHGSTPVVITSANFEALVSLVTEAIEIGENGTSADHTETGLAYKALRVLGFIR